MKSTGLWLSVLAVALAVVVVLAPASIAQAGPSGAIFTTDEFGTFVNGNVYEDGGQVYLNGGPRPNAPCTAAGLSTGDYVFQVTDPSGAVLLSTFDDVDDRWVHVENGVIDDNRGTHLEGTGPCGLTVQLWPFAPTPNPGGEYKVWMTLRSDYLIYGGFVHSKSKTDNFKVVPPEGPGD
jgi:hypothetical protein